MVNIPKDALFYKLVVLLKDCLSVFVLNIVTFFILYLFLTTYAAHRCDDTNSLVLVPLQNFYGVELNELFVFVFHSISFCTLQLWNKLSATRQ